jgi:hypothetical protein
MMPGILSHAMKVTDLKLDFYPHPALPCPRLHFTLEKYARNCICNIGKLSPLAACLTSDRSPMVAAVISALV